MTEDERKATQMIELFERMKRRFAKSDIVTASDVRRFVMMFFVALEEFKDMQEGKPQ